MGHCGAEEGPGKELSVCVCVAQRSLLVAWSRSCANYMHC